MFAGASAALRQIQLVGPVAVLVLGPPGGPEIRPTHKDGNRKWAHAMGLFWGPHFGPLSARLRAPEAGRFLSLACVLSSAAEKSWATSGGRLQLLPPLPWAFEGQAWAERRLRPRSEVLLGDAPALPFLGPRGGQESRTVGNRFSATVRGLQARSVLDICWL